LDELLTANTLGKDGYPLVHGAELGELPPANNTSAPAAVALLIAVVIAVESGADQLLLMILAPCVAA
jgi:hypothetical protein